MKIITLHKPINIESLFNHLKENLNAIFHEQRQSDIDFIIERRDDTIEISQPAYYFEVLFRIAVKGNELHITRSEHYIDDVNCLTIESILNNLFEDIAGNLGTDLVLEG